MMAQDLLDFCTSFIKKKCQRFLWFCWALEDFSNISSEGSMKIVRVLSFRLDDSDFCDFDGIFDDFRLRSFENLQNFQHLLRRLAVRFETFSNPDVILFEHPAAPFAFDHLDRLDCRDQLEETLPPDE